MAEIRAHGISANYSARRSGTRSTSNRDGPSWWSSLGLGCKEIDVLAALVEGIEAIKVRRDRDRRKGGQQLEPRERGWRPGLQIRDSSRIGAWPDNIG